MALRRTPTLALSKHRKFDVQARPHQYKYRELTRWQRGSAGLSKWEQNQSHRQAPSRERFNPGNVALTRGTSQEAYKWWWYQQPHLPNMAPEGHEAPTPLGRTAWPAAWTDDMAADILSLTDDEIAELLLQRLTEVIHDETLKDGYDMRRMDFEGNPMTDLPERKVIEGFVLEEDTIRERVLQRVVEDELGFTPNSTQREAIRDVPNLVRYVIARVTRCREPESHSSTSAVREFLAGHPLQPKFGAELALPQDTRNRLSVEWEKGFFHEHQFGRAAFTPRSMEDPQNNMAWMREQESLHQRDLHAEAVANGSAREAHLAKVRMAE